MTHLQNHGCSDLRVRVVLILFASFFLGCGDRPQTFPVEGRVVYEDGKAMTGGTVEFLTIANDGNRINARGVIDDSGSFSLTTFEEGDGALEGEHQAVVVAPSTLQTGDVTKLRQARDIDPKFGSYATSGLSFSVEPGANRFVITVTRTE